MDAVFANNLLNGAGLYNGNLTHVGIACSCGSTGNGALCGFLFTHTYIGFEVTEPKPKFIPYTPKANCPSVPLSSLYEVSSCLPD